MIETDREYEAAQARARENARYLAAYESALIAEQLSAAEIENLVQPIQAFDAQLLDEIAQYERMRRGEFTKTPFETMGLLLIGLRIASGITQRELAQRLCVDESVVSRDERNEYHGITIERMLRILTALNVKMTAEIEAAPWLRSADHTQFATNAVPLIVQSKVWSYKAGEGLNNLSMSINGYSNNSILAVDAAQREYDKAA